MSRSNSAKGQKHSSHHSAGRYRENTAGQNNSFAATQTYNYDSLNRLKDASETIAGIGQTWKQTYKYDRFGNREFDAANTTTLGSCPQTVCNPSINTADNRFNTGQ